MTELKISEVASAVIDALHGASPDHPDAGNGRPVWYYDLCSRIAVLIGDSEILFVSHSFNDYAAQDGTAWLFTEHLAVRGSYVGDGQKGQVEVQAIGRRSLQSLAVDELSNAFGQPDDFWPRRIRVSLDYGHVDVTLPLETSSYQAHKLAALLPALALDLNG